MNWALLAGGCRNGTVGFKKMTKLPNNGNTYNKPIPTNVLFGFKAPLCLCPTTPLNRGVYTAHSHRETGRPSSLPRAASCALCPRMAMSQEQGAAQCPEIYENTHVKKGMLCRERSCGQAWCMGAIRAGLQQLSAVLFNCLKNCHSNSSHT